MRVLIKNRVKLTCRPLPVFSRLKEIRFLQLASIQTASSAPFILKCAFLSSRLARNGFAIAGTVSNVLKEGRASWKI